MVVLHRALHSISFLDNTHGRKTSGVSCHHCPWTTHTDERHRTRNGIIIVGQQKWSNDVGCGMSSSPLDNIHDRMTSGVACYHRLWIEHTIERRRAWHSIIALGQHTRSDDIVRDMLSSHLGRKHNRTTSGLVCNHLPWTTHTVE